MHKVLSADGTAIAYDTVGSGPPVILVDGAFGSRSLGPNEPLAPLLATGLTAVTYDRRGRGDSGDAPRSGFEREVEDLAALVEAIGGGAFPVRHLLGSGPGARGREPACGRRRAAGRRRTDALHAGVAQAQGRRAHAALRHRPHRGSPAGPGAARGALGERDPADPGALGRQEPRMDAQRDARPGPDAPERRARRDRARPQHGAEVRGLDDARGRVLGADDGPRRGHGDPGAGAQGRPGQGHLRDRQLRAGPDADAARPRRRVPSLGPSRRPGLRQAAVPARRTRSSPDPLRREDDGDRPGMLTYRAARP